MSTLNTIPATAHTILIQFDWNGTTTRYTQYSKDVTSNGFTWTSETSIEVENSRQNASMTDVPYYIKMLPQSPINLIARPYQSAVTTVTIAECDPRDGSSYNVIFKGQISKFERNKFGTERIVRLEVSGIRSLIQYPVMLEAREQCNWQLGDSNCCVNLSSLVQNLTVTAINSKVVTVTGLTIPSDTNFFQFGYASYGSINIEVMSTTTTTLTLRWLPPPEWQGQTIQLYPGCDKRIATCRSRFNNESNFAGIGYSIPLYDPQTQQAGHA